MNGGALAGEGIYWMISSSPSRLILWFVTLFCPALLIVVDFSGVTIFAPVWLLGLYAHVFLMFLGFPPPLFQSFIIYLLAPIFLTFPVLLATMLLEMVPRHTGWLGRARSMILFYPTIVLLSNVLWLMIYSDMLIVPVPLAALVQYVRYRQLSKELQVLPPAASEPAFTV